MSVGAKRLTGDDMQLSRRKRSPESVELDRMKGKNVELAFVNGLTLHGRLEWVDRYSFGVRVHGHDAITIAGKGHYITLRESAVPAPAHPK